MTCAIIVACIFLFVTGCSNNRVSTNDEPKLFEFPDGSSMILNQNSEVEFVMDGETRKVQLEGEAFFKVKKGDVPFEVHTPNGVITVLGTAFNVRSSEKELDVEVEAGIVEVETANCREKLRRGERVLYDDVKKLVKKGQAEFKHHIWTDEFKNDLRKIGKEVEKNSKKLGKEIKKISKDIKIKL